MLRKENKPISKCFLFFNFFYCLDNCNSLSFQGWSKRGFVKCISRIPVAFKVFIQ